MQARESAVAGRFIHQALIYGSEDEFVRAALPFVRAGIADDEPTLVAVKAPNVEALSEALGPDADRVELKTVEEWYETATRTRMKFATWVEERLEGAERVRLIGEPPWPLDSEARVRDWARHESVLNVAFQDVPLTFACPYDTRELPGDVIEHAGCTHPEILTAAGTQPSDSYADPLEYCARLNTGDEPPGGEATAELAFTRTSLPALRRLVEAECAAAGLRPERIHDVVVAANEIATNAVVYGGEPARLRAWRLPGELVIDVTDNGPGPRDPLAGQLKPELQRPGGWGLWIARMLTDALDIRSGEGGTTIAIHVSTSAEREPLPVH